MRKSFLVNFLLGMLWFAPLSAWAEMKVSLKLVSEPISIGANKIEIRLSDTQGKSLKSATTKLQASMPAMGTMPYMEVQADMSRKSDDTFLSEVELPMGGTWDLTLTVENSGSSSVFRYSVTTEIPGILDKNQGATAATMDHFSPDRLQRIGVRFATVGKATMQKSIRSTGVLEADVSRRSEVTLRFGAYVKTFSGKRLGEPVIAGEVLAVVESPEIVAAQREIVLALQLPADGHLDRNSAAERLRTLGMSESDVNSVIKNKSVIQEFKIRAPQSGTLLEANVRAGSRVEQGQVLFVVGDLKKNYVVGKIFQQDMSFVKKGQRVEIIVPGMENKRTTGVVDLVYPNVSEGAGTANVRIIPSSLLPLLQPGNYVQIQIAFSWPAALVVPAEAVLFSGQHSYVFVDKGGGSLEPVEVTMGRRTSEQIELLDGVSEGQRVAASGTFLLSSEANLRSALPKWKSNGVVVPREKTVGDGK